MATEKPPFFISKIVVLSYKVCLSTLFLGNKRLPIIRKGRVIRRRNIIIRLGIKSTIRRWCFMKYLIREKWELAMSPGRRPRVVLPPLWVTTASGQKTTLLPKSLIRRHRSTSLKNIGNRSSRPPSFRSKSFLTKIAAPAGWSTSRSVA